MTSRHSARRHRGSNRMVARTVPDPAWQQERKQDAIDDLCSPAAAAALRLWTAELPHPLFVYFIQADHGNGPVKIGQAQDPIKRLRTLQCAHWERLIIRSLILATDTTERLLHSHWGCAAIRGEWFGCGYEQVIITVADECAVRQTEARAAGGSLRNVQMLSIYETLMFIWGDKGEAAR